MLKIDGNNTIHITRGDFAQITVNLNERLSNNSEFSLNVYEANNMENCIFSSYTEVAAPEITDTAVNFYIYPEDTEENIPVSNGPLTYWYEIEYYLNDMVTTLVGYDAAGPKLFIVYPEIGEIEEIN